MKRSFALLLPLALLGCQEAGGPLLPEAAPAGAALIIGTAFDLNTTIPEGSGWVLRSAESINDGGQIVGYGSYQGESRAFLLTPAE